MDELEQLRVGEFHIKEGNKPSIRVKAPSNLVKNKNAMSALKFITAHTQNE